MLSQFYNGNIDVEAELGSILKSPKYPEEEITFQKSILLILHLLVSVVD